jgi:hypothetical protein
MQGECRARIPCRFAQHAHASSRGERDSGASGVFASPALPGAFPIHDRHRVVSETPLVSVVAIFLNGERFLDEAIRSVLAQSHPRWELLLVDDGSSDGSGAISSTRDIAIME